MVAGQPPVNHRSYRLAVVESGMNAAEQIYLVNQAGRATWRPAAITAPSRWLIEKQGCRPRSPPAAAVDAGAGGISWPAALTMTP